MTIRTDDFPTAVSAMRAALDLQRAPVGVKLFGTPEEYEAFDAAEPRVALHYCAIVKLASEGRSYKMTSEHMRCSAAEHFLGLGEVPDELARAEEYAECGLYPDAATAAEVLAAVPTMPHASTGIAVAPLVTFTAEAKPDVAIVVAPVYAAMRLVQAYGFRNPEGSSVCMRGQHGICAESTVAPLLSGEMTVSLLCSGTRFIAKWDETEVAVSMPAGRFAEVAEAVLETLSAYETDERKRAISDADREALEALGTRAGLGDAYFMRS